MPPRSGGHPITRWVARLSAWQMIHGRSGPVRLNLNQPEALFLCFTTGTRFPATEFAASGVGTSIGGTSAMEMAMITGMHAVVYTRNAEADRAFFKDVLGFSAVDAGGGWLIFAAPPSELACHPAESNGRHELYLMCDRSEERRVGKECRSRW